jgi:hydroxyacylglutathione hydrolase
MGGDLPKRVDDLRGLDGTIAIVCRGGYRSTAAASVLERAGIGNVVNVTGGMRAWTNAGLPTSKG